MRLLKVRNSHNHPEQTAEELFIGLLHKKLAQVLVQESRISRKMLGKELTEKRILMLIEKIKHFKTEVIKTNPFEQAQICAGGVDTREIHSATMESKRISGLYFAGEIVDVDGIAADIISNGRGQAVIWQDRARQKGKIYDSSSSSKTSHSSQ